MSPLIALSGAAQDLTPANFIAEQGDGGKVWLIDWEWAGPGDRLADLATFCALSEQVSLPPQTPQNPQPPSALPWWTLSTHHSSACFLLSGWMG